MRNPGTHDVTHAERPRITDDLIRLNAQIIEIHVHANGFQPGFIQLPAKDRRRHIVIPRRLDFADAHCTDAGERRGHACVLEFASQAVKLNADRPFERSADTRRVFDRFGRCRLQSCRLPS